MIKFKMDLTLEEIFYNNLKWSSNDCYIIHSSSTNFLNESNINLIANHSKCEVIRDITNHQYVLWISNSADNPDNISFSINGGDSIYLQPNGYYFFPVSMGQVFEVMLTENSRSNIKRFSIEEKNLSHFNTSGEIKFR